MISMCTFLARDFHRSINEIVCIHVFVHISLLNVQKNKKCYENINILNIVSFFCQPMEKIDGEAKGIEIGNSQDGLIYEYVSLGDHGCVDGISSSIVDKSSHCNG